MAIPFLNNISLSDNELQNAKLHITGTAPSAEPAQIYYNSSADTARYHNDTEWVNIVELVPANSTFINLVKGSSSKASLTASLNATGTPSSTTYLRGDNTWSTITDNNTTYTLGVDAITGNSARVNLVGSDSTNDYVNFVGGTNLVSSYTTTGEKRVIFDLTSNISVQGTLTVGGDSTFNGDVDMSGNSITDLAAPVNGTDAATKQYVDDSVVGGLVYQGGYNAATNSPNLAPPLATIIEKGFTYTVTADGTFFTEQVRVGDVLIAEVNGPTTLADWTTVQNNIDLADASTVGIGNVAAGVDNLDGIHVSYNSYGTAFVGLDIEGLPIDNLSEISESFEIPLYNSVDDINRKSSIKDLVELVNSTTSKAYTINDTATITYPFTLTTATKNDVIIQLVDFVTNETVYADVDRISTTQATITFASTPTNAVRVLVHKIG